MAATAELVKRYQHFREVSKRLNLVLPNQLPKDAFEAGARDLGMWHKGKIVFDGEHELAILMDYCLYNVLRDGRNAIQIYLADHPPKEGSDEEIALNAMSESWHSVFEVTATELGAGIHVHDILRRSDHLMLDVNLSRTARIGDLFATRVVPFDMFVMSGGAGLPMPGDKDQREKLTKTLSQVAFSNNITSFEHMNPKQAKELARAIVTTALSSGASSRVRYRDADEPLHQGRGEGGGEYVPVMAGSRVGRNEPCPCGSGMKYKKCCGQ